MNITFNGEKIVIESTSLIECLNAQNIDTDKKGIAVALNDTVVSRNNWQDAQLGDGDVVEVVRPFQGG